MERDKNVIESEEWYRTRFFSRLIAVLAPPLGLVMLLTSNTAALSRKVAGSILLTFYTVAYVGLGLWAGIALDWWQLDWRGGDLPVLVGRRSESNVLSLEQDRERQADLPPLELDPLTAPKPYWTDFRGPKRDGHYEEGRILTRWPVSGLRELWRQPCGGGYASFVVAEGLAFTIEQRREQEVIAAYHLESGREIWTYAYPTRFHEWQGGDGPRATPTYNRGRVYSLGAEGDLICFGASSGTAIWQRNILDDAHSQNLPYGMAASPLIVGERLFAVSGTASETGTLLAYDALTGDKLWSVIPEQQSYTSPLAATLAGRSQVLSVSSSRILGLDPETREVLWDFPWSVRSGNAICPPVVVDDRHLFVGAGYGAGGVMLTIREAAGGRLQAEPLWRARTLRTKFNPAVSWQGHLYGLDEGVLACVDARNGNQVWRAGRYGYGQLLLASGHLVILCGDGALAIVKATPAGFTELRRFRALSGKTWNVPALAHGRLLVRNASEMACYQIGLADL